MNRNHCQHCGRRLEKIIVGAETMKPDMRFYSIFSEEYKKNYSRYLPNGERNLVPVYICPKLSRNAFIQLFQAPHSYFVKMDDLTNL